MSKSQRKGVRASTREDCIEILRRYAEAENLVIDEGSWRGYVFGPHDVSVSCRMRSNG